RTRRRFTEAETRACLFALRLLRGVSAPSGDVGVARRVTGPAEAAHPCRIDPRHRSRRRCVTRGTLPRRRFWCASGTHSTHLAVADARENGYGVVPAPDGAGTVSTPTVRQLPRRDT